MSDTDLAIIVRSDNPESVYPAFILATTAASMNMKVEMFFTFWGLRALLKGGAEYIEKKFRKQLEEEGMSFKGITPLKDLVNMAKSLENIKIYACSTTMDAMNISKNDLIDDLPVIGAPTFLSKHGKSGAKIIVF